MERVILRSLPMQLLTKIMKFFFKQSLLSLDGSKVFRAHKTGLIEKAVSIGLDVAEEILDKRWS